MTWDKLLYFPSEGRRDKDFLALKNPTASAGLGGVWLDIQIYILLCLFDLRQDSLCCTFLNTTTEYTNGS